MRSSGDGREALHPRQVPRPKTARLAARPEARGLRNVDQGPRSEEWPRIRRASALRRQRLLYQAWPGQARSCQAKPGRARLGQAGVSRILPLAVVCVPALALLVASQVWIGLARSRQAMSGRARLGQVGRSRCSDIVNARTRTRARSSPHTCWVSPPMWDVARARCAPIKLLRGQIHHGCVAQRPSQTAAGATLVARGTWQRSCHVAPLGARRAQERAPPRARKHQRCPVREAGLGGLHG